MTRLNAVILATCALACGGSSPDQGDGGTTPDGGQPNDSSNNDGSPNGPKIIFVIAMENQSLTAIDGNTTDAPYINGTLLTAYAHTTSFTDELPLVNSEPHYVWMESGTNKFSDTTFTTDNDPSMSNSTSSTAHLATQLNTAGISWTSYQEGMTPGTCPVSSISSTFYAAKHDPFVFFQDIAGNPPATGTAGCIAHHKPLSALGGDLGAAVSRYNFITPDLCHDMHGDSACSQGTDVSGNIHAGDNWLMTNLQPIIDYAMANNGYVFITWDEGDKQTLQTPFIAIGKHVKAGYTGTVAYNHSSMLKSEEEILGVPILPTVMSASDLADLFESGTFP